MKKLKFNVNQLVSKRRQHFAHIFPHEANVQLIKLSYFDAMVFDKHCRYENRDPVDFYGQDNLLKEGEFYDGYALCVEGNKHKHYLNTVVKMRGAISRIPPSEADKDIYGYTADEIRAGKAWQIECPPENGKKRDWYFVEVLTFADYNFSEMVKIIQERSDELQGVNPKKFEENLQGNLVNALISKSKDKIVTLTREEDMVLHAALARDYKAIFERLE